MAYIIGTYNKYDSWDREHQRFQFEVNGLEYAVFEVSLIWGIPQLPMRVNRNETGHEYQIYETLDNALDFVRQIKRMNAR